LDKKINIKQFNLVQLSQKLVNSKSLLASVTLIFAVVFVSFNFLGVLHNYSGVPFWDEWNGNLQFVVNFGSDNLSSIFAQHNEHRIVLFRLIALFNYYFVNSQIWFLILINILVLIGITHILFKYIELMLHPKLNLNAQSRIFLISILVIIESSWMQEQNINWGFQSQFLLGIYLPLLAFYFLHKFWQTNKVMTLNLAIFFGILSVGTFASGITVLPLMLLGALICNRDRPEILKLLLSTFLVVSLYFLTYSTPGQHSSPITSTLTNIYGVIKFFVVFVTAPIIKSFGEENVVLIFLIFIGLVFYVLTLLFNALSSRNLMSSEGVFVLPTLFLFTFVGLTSMGRADFGARGALASRYTSVTLILYIIVCFVYLSRRIKLKEFKTSHSWAVLAIVVTLLLPVQAGALVKNNNAFDQRLSAMSLNLSLHDDEQVSRIFPNPDYLYQLAPKIISKNKGIFSDPIFRKSRSHIRVSSTDYKIATCEVRIDEVFTSEKGEYVKVFGWSFIQSLNQTIGNFLVLNSEGKIVGAGLSGAIRKDVDSYLKKSNIDAGFAFYSKSNKGDLIIVNPLKGIACELPKFN
jgi:hypothetical protein